MKMQVYEHTGHAFLTQKVIARRTKWISPGGDIAVGSANPSTLMMNRKPLPVCSQFKKTKLFLSRADGE